MTNETDPTNETEPTKCPVTIAVVARRVRRALTGLASGLKLRATRTREARAQFGSHYVIDARGHVLSGSGGIESIARGLEVLAEHERIIQRADPVDAANYSHLEK